MIDKTQTNGAAVPTDSGSSTRPGFRNRMVLAVALSAAALVGLVVLRPHLTLDNLAAQEDYLRGLYQRHPVSVIAVAFAIYVIVTGFSVPGATGLSLTYGWFFGFVGGVVLVSFASTAGATVAFLLSRYLFREAVRTRFGTRVTQFDDALTAEGSYFLFTLRLIPAVPFFVINAAMGLTPIRTSTFWWVSQLGMLPGTALYLYAGASVPSLKILAEKGLGAAFTPTQITQLFIAFVLLGLFPLAARWVGGRLGVNPRISKPATEDRANKQ